MSTLFGKSVASTYKDLLQVSNNNIGVDNVVRYIEDGEGTRSALALSTDTVVLSGHLLPQVHEQVDLGAPELKFRHLYLSDNTIYIGDETFNTTDIKVVKDIQTTATVPISSVIELAQGAAQAGDIDASFFTDEFSTEYAQVKSLAGNSVQPGTNPTFENINVTGAITGPDVMVLDPAAIGDNTGKVVIAGDLQVDGTTTTVNSTTISTSGKTIELANGATDAASSDGAGVYVSGSQATLKYSAANDSWTNNKGFSVEGATSLNNTTNSGTLDVIGDTNMNNVEVAGNTNLNGTLQVGDVFRVGQSGAIGGVAPTTIGQTVVWNGSEWVTGITSGDVEDREVPEAFVYSLASGMTNYTINFQQTYTTPPALTTNLQIDGDGDIIPYAITNVTTTGFSVVFAEAIPNNNYKLHITFGGRDVYWTQGTLNELSYTGGDVNVTNGLHVGGNLTVQGETTTINASELSIEDRDIVLANNTSSQHLSGLNGQAGITWGDDDKVKLRYDSTQGFSFLAGDLNGNVGIGTANPGYNLHITGGSPALKLEGTQPRIWLSENDQTDLNTLIRNRNSAFQIDTVSDNDVFIANRLTILNTNGNVGIGTTTPVHTLDIKGSARIERNDGGVLLQFTDTGVNSRWIGMVDGTSNFAIYGTDGLTQELTIKNDGNVGIGTTSPDSLLHVKGNGSVETKLTIDSGSSSHAACIGFSADNERAKILGGYDSGGGGFIKFNTDTAGGTATDRMIIDNEGNVGIGTNSPKSALHIEGSGDGNTTLKIENRGGVDSGTEITFQGYRDVDADHWVARIVANHVPSTAHSNLALGADLEFYTWNGSSGSEEPKLTITQDGNVGIGTRTPASKLHVAGDGDSSNYYSILKLGNPAWNQAGGCGFSFHRRDSDKWAGLQINTELDDGMAILIRNTSKAPNPSFGLNGDGTITHCAGINLGSVNGNAANTLDDYEEGTFSPLVGTIDGGSVLYTYSPTTAQGTYIKVGKMVHVRVRVNKVSLATDNNDNNMLVVWGLPYTIDNTNMGIHFGESAWFDNGDQGTDLVTGVYVSATQKIYFPRNTTTGSNRYVKGHEMKLNRMLYFTASYTTI